MRSFFVPMLMLSVMPLASLGLSSHSLAGPLPECYHTYDEIRDALETYASDYPYIAHVEEVGRSTEYQSAIYAIKISDNAGADEDEPSIIFTGGTHAEEVMGIEICMEAIRRLLTGYGIDPAMTDRVDRYQIWFIPLVNPDGHRIVVKGLDREWRRDLLDVNEDGKWDECDGVDLNRNFDYYWSWGVSQTCDYNYRGPYPFSEGECVAVKKICERERPLLGINYHSPARTHGNCVYYCWYEPYLYKYAPDLDVIARIAEELALRIHTESGYAYTPILGYLQDGKARTWQYAKTGCLAYTIEVLDYEAQPPCERIPIIVDNNLKGLFWLVDRLGGPGLTGRVTESSSTRPPTGVEVRVLENYDPDYAEPMAPRTTDEEFGRYWRPLNPDQTYTVWFIKEGYDTVKYSDVVVNEGGWTTLNAVLSRTFIVAGDETGPSPISLRLGPSTPNPFSRRTEISFSLPRAEKVALRIYDTEGRLVTTPLEGYLTTGEHRAEWNGRDRLGSPVSPGVYFYRLESPGEIRARKLVLGPQ